MRPPLSALNLVGILLLITLACAEDTSGPPGLEPFDATLPATVWLEATGGRCPGLTGIVTGSGEAIPGGPFTFEASHCVDTSRVVVDSVIQLTDGRFAFNFVSGSTLTGRLEGWLHLQETGLYNILADLWFEGGPASLHILAAAGAAGPLRKTPTQHRCSTGRPGRPRKSGSRGRTTPEQPRSELATASLLRS